MIRSFRGIAPKVALSAYVDPSAQVIGDVEIGERSSVWPNASLRGDIDASLASELRTRAGTGRQQRCDIAAAGNFAQVSWGTAFGGNDARHKVMFERVADQWVEILRYEAPTPTPARTNNKGRRGKGRILWAQESIRRPDVSTADSKS